MKLIFANKNLFVYQNTLQLLELKQHVLPLLSKLEKQKYQSFKNNKRREEWLGIRYILKCILDIKSEIKYTEYGNPYLSDGRMLSISHTSDILAVTFGVFKYCSLDIELISDKIRRISHKFISDTAQKEISLQHKEQIHLQWSAKEVLFKLYKKGRIDYRNNLSVEIPSSIKNEGQVSASIKKTDFSKNFKLNCKMLDINNKKYILVWVLV